ncbi:MAG TPA: hypothetical protein PK379_02370 [Candidatus Hydrogenedentes bacterium]|nr:tetratricopeptide repeat protein [Candidatus Hydrogenedentota bacterium]HOJ69236.1 hypothetical protein [Candidatus Hydrogenedentota bacterium]HOK88851.1 hypothetical protein [Candidatus Hydrogenedentota bacterium]
MITNEEAKRLYEEARGLIEAGDFEQALEKLNVLDRERPNSRRVTYYRALCLARSGKPDMAKAIMTSLTDRIEPEALEKLRQIIARVEADSKISSTGHELPPELEKDNHEPLTVLEPNLLQIQSVISTSVDTCTVMAVIRSGLFRLGDSLKLPGTGGQEELAEILRIGTANAPLRFAREGMVVPMLVKAQSTRLVPGMNAGCRQKKRDTKVSTSRVVPEERGPVICWDETLENAERLSRKKEYAAAAQQVESYLETHPESVLAHRLMAEILRDAPPPLGNVEQALAHATRAYEDGGFTDPPTVYLYAELLASNGDTEKGLCALEELYETIEDPHARNALAERIRQYRREHGLGVVWQFSDASGEVLFETADRGKLLTALRESEILRNARCRVDRVGGWQDAKSLVVPAIPEAAEIFGITESTSPGDANRKLKLAIILLVAAIILAIVVPILFNMF